MWSFSIKSLTVYDQNLIGEGSSSNPTSYSLNTLANSLSLYPTLKEFKSGYEDHGS